MISPYKYTYILSLVCLSILTSSCSATSEKKHEISHQSQTQKASSNPEKLKNCDGFLITSLPYNSNAHLNCILSAQRLNCGPINLIDSTSLIKVYDFINPNYVDSVIFPKTSDGVLLIASPFSSESGHLEINLTSVNKLGSVKSITLDASKNIEINQNYEILYKENKKDLKLKLNEQGDFVK
ncbi:hypothetical protein F901_00950 [Acinetobacter dispersus]|uniref:hypothetical protein n=1 Tax=Acinetobacter dispersus TaxID=70348 RepID=UPI0002D042E8|nr:hypothetical protein [Acinetobacter dispersus]ENX53683.1 hypothetical protein F901_00950 [Acinetobacter dispersus]